MILECWTPSRTCLVLIGITEELEAVADQIGIRAIALIHMSASQRVLPISGDALDDYREYVGSTQHQRAIGPILGYHPRELPCTPRMATAGEIRESGAGSI